MRWGHAVSGHLLCILAGDQAAAQWRRFYWSIRLVHGVLVSSELCKATARAAGVDSLPSAQLSCSEGGVWRMSPDKRLIKIARHKSEP